MAEEIALDEVPLDRYLTSGNFELSMMVWIPQQAEVGPFINDRLLGFAGMIQPLTTMIFKLF